MRGNVHPRAREEFDQGMAPSDLAMDRILLVLKRSDAQEAELQKFLSDVNDPRSAEYQHFLTPREFGERFGANEADIQTISTWLAGQGFRVEPANQGRTMIEFSGTASQVNNALHTQIHRYRENGVDHWANSQDVQIPAALAPAIIGFASLNNFPIHPQSHISRETFSGQAKQAGGIQPLFTSSSSGAHALSPGDFNIIYNVKGLSGITGAGASIAVVGRSNIIAQDVLSFRSLFGLSATGFKITLNGTDPGVLSSGEEVEAVLDASWAGAAAPNASVTLVISKSTNTTDGVTLSEKYIIDNNLADIMTESFGNCEANYTSTSANAISTMASQAAAQGISYMVSSGDSGSAGCDSSSNATASGPISANVLGTSPYTLTVGGTQFNEHGSSSYWNALNSSGYVSATQYIPEEVWNANCTGTTCGAGSIIATGGGASKFFAKPSWQTGVTGIPADGKRDVPDVSLTAAGHDPYLICLHASCTANSSGQVNFTSVYGTSASAPAFAGIMALVRQSVGARIGLPAPKLYQLAATQTYASCNGSGATPPAGNCIFNDATIGTNSVPGQTAYNTASASYNATVGFDLATGLGSVNVANLVVGWTGGVITTAPTAAVSPSSLTFASQTVASTSAAQTVTLSNSGTAALSISGVSISGTNAGDFAKTTTCGATLAAGANCSISVTFTPSAAGSRSASLVITDNTGNVAGSTQSVALTGTGATATSGGSAKATYAGTDTSTLGNWSGKYGGDGYWIPNDLTSPASYATLSFTGQSLYTWTASTSDGRALQVSNGSSSRIASTYYAPSSFSVDVNITDGNPHQIALYFCDWDYNGRNETISLLDASTGAVLDTRSYSNFSGGVWAVWNISGHVTIRATNNGGNNAVINGILLGSGSSSGGGAATASYTGTDTSTLGAWTGKYGSGGLWIPNDVTTPASYATLTFSGQSLYTWAANTSDARALQVSSGSSARIASTYYASPTFTVDVNITDGQSHQLALYLCDWDYGNRVQTISVSNASSGAVLDTRTYSSFSGGVWAVWTISGHVVIRATNTAGANALINGIFLGN